MPPIEAPKKYTSSLSRKSKKLLEFQRNFIVNKLKKVGFKIGFCEGAFYLFLDIRNLKKIPKNLL
jgi:hypothetical protein